MRTYTPSATWSTTYSLAEDAVDDDNAAAFNSPIEALADSAAAINTALDSKLLLKTLEYDNTTGGAAVPAHTIGPTLNAILYFDSSVADAEIGDVYLVHTELEFKWRAAPSAGGDTCPVSIYITDGGTPHSKQFTLSRKDDGIHMASLTNKWTASTATVSISVIAENSDSTQTLDILRCSTIVQVFKGFSL